MITTRNKNIALSLGRWAKEELDRIIQEASKINDAGERIAFLSKHFLGVAYKESTLIGDRNTPEVFVINLEGMDCMTFIEYVEAMRLSGSFSAFLENLKRVRYSQGQVAFENRNHFFTHWIETVEDMADRIAGATAVTVKKRLNLKKNGGYIIQGVPYKDREIKYIPADAIDDAVLDKLKTGDYAGMYSKDDGLDVAHVGIIVKGTVPIYGEVETGMRRMGTVPVFLRHASSVARKVVDEDFRKYIAKKDGIVVLRPC